MAFSLKTWVDRISEYPTRRTLTKEDGSTELVTVTREEGTVSQEGDAFNAETMNDLETRIKEAFTDVEDNIAELYDVAHANSDTLRDDVIKKTNIVDNLTTASRTNVLSANQGKVLNDKITSGIGCIDFSTKADISAGAAQSIEGNADCPSEYIPIGIIQFDTGNSNAVIEKVNVSAHNETAYFRVKNTGTSLATITLKYTVLCVKRTLFSYLSI